MAKILVHTFDEFIDARYIETAAEVGFIESNEKTRNLKTIPRTNYIVVSGEKLPAG